MQDSAIVTPSTGSEQYTAGKNDVYLTSGKTITVESTLTSTDPVARITPQSYRETPVLTGAITTGLNYTKFTVTPNGSEQWKIDSNGKLKRK